MSHECQSTLPSTLYTSDSSNPIPEVRAHAVGSQWTPSDRLRILGLLRKLTVPLNSETEAQSCGLTSSAYRMLKAAILSGKHDDVMQPLHPWSQFDPSRITYGSEVYERLFKDLKHVLRNILSGDAAGIGTRIQQVRRPAQLTQVTPANVQNSRFRAATSSWYDDSPDPASSDATTATAQVHAAQVSHSTTPAISTRVTGPTPIRILERFGDGPSGNNILYESSSQGMHTYDCHVNADVRSHRAVQPAQRSLPLVEEIRPAYPHKSEHEAIPNSRAFYANAFSTEMAPVLPLDRASLSDLPSLETSMATRTVETEAGQAPFGATVTTHVQRHVDVSQVSLRPSLGGSESCQEPTVNRGFSDMSRPEERTNDRVSYVSLSDRRNAGTIVEDVTILYYASDMGEVAQRVADISRGCVILHEIQFCKFADGFPNIFLENVKDVRYNRVAYLASLHDQAALFEQLSVLYTLPRYGAFSFTAIVPWFPTGTMERVDKVGQVATAKTLARMLSIIPPSSTGPPHLVLFDVHALQELFYFDDSVMVRPKSCVHLLIDRLLQLEDTENIAIAFPDEGAYKRFHSHFDSIFPIIVCAKRRENEERKIIINEGNPQGKHVVIVDDLVQTGGTLLQCARALNFKGASCISAYVTHGVFPNQSWKKFLPSECGNLFQQFWITDSIPTTAKEVENRPPFEILSIAETISSVLSER